MPSQAARRRAVTQVLQAHAQAPSERRPCATPELLVALTPFSEPE